MASKIDYVKETWNIVVGCTPVSPGCKHCWARRIAVRMRGIALARKLKTEVVGDVMVTSRPPCLMPDAYMDTVDDNGRWTGRVHRIRKLLDAPYHWRKPRTVLVASTGDLCHAKVPESFIQDAEKVMSDCSTHTFLVLTKRPERMFEVFRKLVPCPNIFLGVSVEDTVRWRQRIRPLYQLSELGWRTWVSCEPLLWDIPRACIESWLDWVVVGCESLPGGKAGRPCPTAWVEDIVKASKAARVPVYVKQIPVNGRVSHEPTEWPRSLRVRQMPRVNDGR